MKKYLVDFRNVSNIIEAHKVLKKTFNFPDYYGENLDALNDFISDLGDIYIKIKIKKDKFCGFDDIIKVFDDNNIKYDILYGKRPRLLNRFLQFFRKH